MDVDVENDVAFIESALGASGRAYVHKYDSSTRYSTTQFDILVLEYLQTSAYPIFRLWINYCADDAYMNITSVSFYVEDQKYTFSGIADAERYTHDENGYVERLLIKSTRNPWRSLPRWSGRRPNNTTTSTSTISGWSSTVARTSRLSWARASVWTSSPWPPRSSTSAVWITWRSAAAAP